MTPNNKRSVGIVAKARLERAAEHLAQIAAWLEARGVQPVFDPETAALAKATGTSARFDVLDKDRMAGEVQMVVVLGGDGTLLGMAGRIGQSGSGIPILGVNFGSLGFLTEVTLPEIFSSLELALAGTAKIEERMMLRVRVEREAERICDRIVLNDVVVTQGALSRIIDLSTTDLYRFVKALWVKVPPITKASPPTNEEIDEAIQQIKLEVQDGDRPQPSVFGGGYERHDRARRKSSV